MDQRIAHLQELRKSRERIINNLELLRANKKDRSNSSNYINLQINGCQLHITQSTIPFNLYNEIETLLEASFLEVDNQINTIISKIN